MAQPYQDWPALQQWRPGAPLRIESHETAALSLLAQGFGPGVLERLGFTWEKIHEINPKIEIGTRNVIVRATVGNEDHSLLPGMFARVDIAIGAPRKEMTLPQTAIVYNAYGNLVYVVDESGEGPPGADGKPMLTVKQVFVETGATRGDQVAILKGVKDGDTIVSSGQMKLRNGAPIVVNNTIVPKEIGRAHV